MGAAASVNAATASVEDEGEFDPDAELDLKTMQAEAESDLQQVIDYMFDSHLERISIMGDTFRRVRKAQTLEPGASLSKDILIEAFRNDPLVRMLLDMPMRLEEDGSMKTLDDVLTTAAAEVDLKVLTWMDVINRFKSSRVHSSHKLPRMRAVFNMIDTNGNGSVDRAELALAMKKDPRIASFLALPARIHDASKVATKVESDGETKIAPEGAKDESDMIESFMTVFNQIDDDGSKEITWEEFADFVMWS